MATNSPHQPPGASSFAPGSSAEAVEEELLAVVRSWAEAIVANDATRIAAFVTADWVMVSDTGISPGKRFLDLVASGDLTHSAMEVVGPTRVRDLGTTAVLTARVTNTAHYLGRRFDADEWTTDVFVRRDGHWLCELTHYTAVRPSA
ncbi:nuclear transport factor 2 family protein [Kocuria nitroreducens]|uniref:nuclear transport factor 2 family protein n=1 Tax=Kocuria nitroreducens TaxID=3058914 RepID=UPI0036D96BDE